MKRKRGLWLHKLKHKKLKLFPDINADNISTPLNAEPPILHLSQLENAPRKNARKDRKSRKLFTPSEDENITENMLDILPSVLNKLNAAGHRADFCLLLRTINSDRFPLHNIALRLLFDVARWYSLDSTTQMTYSNDSLKFWKVVYKLFHGKVLRFLSGTKSVGQVDDKGMTQV